ncbi:unnamed protein product, partial [Timema podura]|nr:unnamed protein product [Timema podura]
MRATTFQTLHFTTCPFPVCQAHHNITIFSLTTRLPTFPNVLCQVMVNHVVRLGKMISLGSCVLVVVIITASVAETLPTNNADFRYIGKPVTISELRVKRTTNPTRAIMYSGYFGSPQGYHYNPPYPGNTYDPQGAMASFAEGNTVSARSYYGNEYQPSNTYPHCGNCGYQQPSNGQGYPNLSPENTGEVLPPGDVISTQQPEEQSKEKPKPTVT